MNVHYKDYLIEPLETSPSRWRARVRRIDGRKIKNFIKNNEAESITMDAGMEYFSVDAAVASAKEIIDGGGMQ